MSVYSVPKISFEIVKATPIPTFIIFHTAAEYHKVRGISSPIIRHPLIYSRKPSITKLRDCSESN